MQISHAPGVYAIFVDFADSLPEPFSSLLKSSDTRLVYVGKSNDSLRKRLIEQDCEHKAPSTCFRGIGAVLGYVPQRGSLREKGNKNNYRFSSSDTARIIEWLEQHLTVRWIETQIENIPLLERAAIQALAALMNKTHNPSPCAELIVLRSRCRQIALADKLSN